MELELGGRVVVITGAGNGLGRAYALAAAAAGGRIVVNDVDAGSAALTVSGIRQRGGDAIAHIGAVDDPDTGIELVELARSHFGRLDALILNAGVLDAAPVLDSTTAAMRRVVEVNLLGTMFCGVPALRAMSEDQAGSLVLVTSGARFGMPGLSTYGPTKGAVASLVWSWALEARHFGVRVNGISPLAQTAMFAAGPGGTDGPDPETVAPVAVYLVSAENSLNGEILRFDGSSLSMYLEQGAALTTPISRSRWSARDVATTVKDITQKLSDTS
jgi:NAD(P)-dependent dehydrogenase (short-subunit alcohol dehydrogenase family)